MDCFITITNPAQNPAMTDTAEVISKCECVLCSYCGGSGFNYELFGDVSQHHPCDDLAEMIPCEECSGSRVVEICDSCWNHDDDDYQH